MGSPRSDERGKGGRELELYPPKGGPPPCLQGENNAALKKGGPTRFSRKEPEHFIGKVDGKRDPVKGDRFFHQKETPAA